MERTAVIVEWRDSLALNRLFSFEFSWSAPHALVTRCCSFHAEPFATKLVFLLISWTVQEIGDIERGSKYLDCLLRLWAVLFGLGQGEKANLVQCLQTYFHNMSTNKTKHIYLDLELWWNNTVRWFIHDQGWRNILNGAPTYIWCIGDDFSETDLLVGVERVNDNIHDLWDIGLEGECVCIGPRRRLAVREWTSWNREKTRIR